MEIISLVNHIKQFIELEDEDIFLLNSICISRPFKKGEIIVAGGDPARYLAFVNCGYTVTFLTDPDGNDHLVRFAAAGWWTGDIYSLGPAAITPLTTKALCDGELLLLPNAGHQQLLKQKQKFESYFRQLFQNALMRHQILFVESRSLSFKLRYLKFQKTFPGIENYLPQKYVASYLGVTPQFLSKLRKTLAQVNLD